MPGRPGEFLPGINDYIEFRHMKENAKEVNQADKPETIEDDDESDHQETENDE